MTGWLKGFLRDWARVEAKLSFAVMFITIVSLVIPGQGAFAQTSITSCPANMPLNDVGNGIAVNDNATGSGWILWTEQNVFSRFSPAPYPQNAAHLIAVQFQNGQWYFDNNGGLNAFVPASSDCLVAEVNFDSDTVELLQNTDSTIQGIDSGYDSGSLNIVPNRWEGKANPGEFGVTGSFISKTVGTTTPNVPVVVSNSVCPATIDIGDIGNGIAASDNAIGEGWILWSEQNVFTRFNPSPYPQNAQHLIAVKYSGGQWLVDNNSSLKAFTPAATDCLVAAVNFSSDTVTPLAGVKTVVAGIDAGYTAGDFSIVANRWANVTNPGEFGVSGSAVVQTDGNTTSITPVTPVGPTIPSTSATSCPASMPLGNVGNGIAASDQAVGSGWIMWSAQSVFTRFSPAPYPQNADHLIAVQYSNGQWYYDNNSALKPFTPNANDCLVATVNFVSDTVSMLAGTNATANGIASGFTGGNLAIEPNVWNGVSNPGEFGVSGTVVTKQVTPVTPTTSVTSCPATIDLGVLGKGIAANDNATGKGWIMWTAQSVFSRFTPVPYPENADHLIAVRYVNGQWFYDNNSGLNTFVPESTDCLLATVDFDTDSVATLNGASGLVNGIDSGYETGHFQIVANRWGGVSNAGEFSVTGTRLTTSNSATVTPITPVVPSPAACPVVMPIGNVGNGIAVDDGATGAGWFMWSEQNVFSRFSPAPYPDNTSNLIAVKYVNGQWYYDNNGGLNAFVPATNDCLIASVNFDTDTVNLLSTTNMLVNGIASGYTTGNITITANIWKGVSNVGEFGVVGTQFNKPIPNVNPVANAGTAQSVQLGEVVQLDGSNSSDEDGVIAAWSWSDVSGEVLGATETIEWTPAAVGVQVVSLTVTDNDGASANSQVALTVTAVPIPPVAIAGVAQSLPLGGVVVLDGSNSADADGSIVSWYWSDEAGNSLGSTATLNWTPSALGVFSIQLLVTDNDGDTSTSHVDITVTEPPVPNVPPVAGTGIVDGTAVSVVLGEIVQLDASSSSDADGNIVSWVWTLLSGEVLGSEENITWMPETIGSFEVTLLIADDDADSDSTSIVVEVVEPPIPSIAQIDDYQLVFGDEFTGTQLDDTVWDTSLLWGPYLPINNEEQLYVDSLGMHRTSSHTPFTLTGDTLKITASKVTADLQPPVRPAENSPSWKPKSYSEYVQNRTVGSPGDANYNPGYDAEDVNYLSGILTSYGTFSLTHGYVEMRAKLPSGAGLWPAFWMLPQHWVEDVPEIDVMEFLGQDVDRLYNTYHYFDVENNWTQISTPSMTVLSEDWTESFHTFGVAWSPTEIVWYVNGQESHRVTDADYDIANQPMHLIANLAVGGNWPGTPDANTVFPAEFEIDYIRAYKRKLNPELDLVNDYQLMFNDEFTGTSLDASKWNTHFLWGPYLPINNEEQYYVDALGSDVGGNSPFSLANGVLSITARASDDPEGFVIPEALPPIDESIWIDFPNFQFNTSYVAPEYTSGIITSYESFKFAHGYAEIKAKIPAGDGLWPAFWLLNGYYVGQQPEIDIMEVRGENLSEIVHSYHYQDPVLVSQSFTTQHPDAQSDYAVGFHTYGMRWEPGKITWYVDGVAVHTLESETVAYQVMYVIANLAVGGDFNYAPTDSSVFPKSFDIDYIRVYQEKGN